MQFSTLNLATLKMYTPPHIFSNLCGFPAGKCVLLTTSSRQRFYQGTKAGRIDHALKMGLLLAQQGAAGRDSMTASLKLRDAKTFSYYGPSGRFGCNSSWQCSGALWKHQHPGPSEVGVIACGEKIEIKAGRHFGQSSAHTWEPSHRHGKNGTDLCRQRGGHRKVHGGRGKFYDTITKKTAITNSIQEE